MTTTPPPRNRPAGVCCYCGDVGCVRVIPETNPKRRACAECYAELVHGLMPHPRLITDGQFTAAGVLRSR